ncbi:two-component system, OmpR family, copper resistance phosphate regulon response regulator CusR [Paraburkholderia fungorum]|uniref:Two-component system, OmpR family, copper resistance phosphate regulon response regulator CusR n=1 Tax=Paraburkholderia fungorum TaxID=134537 RepID=A0A1H1K0K0_9BURK|nr:response regulator [Paraburkholderia fungorum]SDR55530.1 two-component system, OmpR family, copper resistance phosphate regulon response regulator CusR [Paraburkholderia fungorum]
MKVLVIDDEIKVLNYLRKGLAEHGWTVDCAADGHDGHEKALTFDYDVIVLDVMLPGMDGFAVLRSIREEKQTPVIMLTARERVDDRVKGFRDGADDYLIKPFSFLELTERLLALIRRNRVQETMSVTVGNLVVDFVKRQAWRDGLRLDLTSKEFLLLSLLARRAGEIVSKTAITEYVWDLNLETNGNVVESVVKRLRAKLDAPFRSKMLHNIRGMGYLLEERMRTDV